MLLPLRLIRCVVIFCGVALKFHGSGKQVDPDLDKTPFTDEEEETLIDLHKSVFEEYNESRWAEITKRFPRTRFGRRAENDIKNIFNSASRNKDAKRSGSNGSSKLRAYVKDFDTKYGGKSSLKRRPAFAPVARVTKRSNRKQPRLHPGSQEHLSNEPGTPQQKEPSLDASLLPSFLLSAYDEEILDSIEIGETADMIDTISPIEPDGANHMEVSEEHSNVTTDVHLLTCQLDDNLDDLFCSTRDSRVNVPSGDLFVSQLDSSWNGHDDIALKNEDLLDDESKYLSSSRDSMCGCQVFCGDNDMTSMPVSLMRRRSSDASSHDLVMPSASEYFDSGPVETSNANYLCSASSCINGDLQRESLSDQEPLCYAIVEPRKDCRLVVQVTQNDLLEQPTRCPNRNFSCSQYGPIPSVEPFARSFQRRNQLFQCITQHVTDVCKKMDEKCSMLVDSYQVEILIRPHEVSPDTCSLQVNVQTTVPKNAYVIGSELMRLIMGLAE